MMSLILVSQSELIDILKKQIYEAICQIIDIRYHLAPYDKQNTGYYIKKHLEYYGESRDIFTENAINTVYEYNHDVASKIDKICTAFLMPAFQK